MVKFRVPSPKSKLRIRREGDKIQITATVTKVHKSEYEGLDKLTFKIPGYSIPITVMASSFGEPDDA